MSFLSKLFSKSPGVVLPAFAGLSIKRFLSPQTPEEIADNYSRSIYKWSEAYNVRAELVAAVIQQESAGRFMAVGSSGELGLMQLTEPALIDFNTSQRKNFPVAALYWPDTNIRIGTWYLSQQIARVGEFNGLRAYNAGPSRAARDSQISRGYANSVLTRADNFQSILLRRTVT